jgi:hypothetical protein
VVVSGSVDGGGSCLGSHGVGISLEDLKVGERES